MLADKQVIDCEYSNVDEMRTCKAFDVSVHGDIICKEEDCIILKLKQALKEIKEIAETCSFTDGSELLLSRIEHIIEKCEVIDDKAD